MLHHHRMQETRRLFDFMNDNRGRLPKMVAIDLAIGAPRKTLAIAMNPNIPDRTLPKKYVIPLGKYLEQYGFKRNVNLENTINENEKQG